MEKNHIALPVDTTVYGTYLVKKEVKWSRFNLINFDNYWFHMKYLKNIIELFIQEKNNKGK